MSVLVLRVSCLTLFNLQGARLRTQSPASAQLLYHSFQSLSRTFFFFFQVLVSALPLSGPPFVTALIEYHLRPLLSSTFFMFFHLFLFFAFLLLDTYYNMDLRSLQNYGILNHIPTINEPNGGPLCPLKFPTHCPPARP